MLDNSKIIRNICYSLIGLIGLSCVAWLIFSLNTVGDDAPIQSQKQETQRISIDSSDDDKPPRKDQLDQAKNSLAQAEVVAPLTEDTDSGQCSVLCRSTLSMLDEDLALDDDTFDRLDAYVKDIAAYLQNNESQRQHYLQIALSTTDGDKRSFLTTIFNHLPYQQKVEIGDLFIVSENWRLRADGVILIADHDTSNVDVANTLMDIFSREENVYVKGSILNHLKQNSALQGNIDVLQQLDSVIYTTTDSSIRVAAFKAKMQLSEQPYHIVLDALQALRTSDRDVQLAGLVAIDQVLEHEKKYIESGAYIDRNSIREDIQIIRNLLVYDDNTQRYDDLIREANTIYLRYFE